MIDSDSRCQAYIDRVKKVVSQLKTCGDPVRDSDVAFPILTGLEDCYSCYAH